MEFKVLGAGCKKCEKLVDNVKQVIQEEGLDANVEKITDIEKIMGYGVMMTPALVIDEDVKSVGKLLSPKAIKKLLK